MAKQHRILVVASSDLYHGPSAEECESTDDRTLELAVSASPEDFCGSLSTGDAQACGGAPIAAVKEYALRQGCAEGRLLRHATSADVTGPDSGYVVGYAAIVFEKPGPAGLSEGERAALLKLAREAVVAAVQGTTPPDLAEPAGGLVEHSGAFVTIYRAGGELRGCIGQMQGYAPLWETVLDMARSAALNDPRFPPMDRSELGDFRIEISVLSPMVETPASEVTPGTHGVLVSGRGRRGVLLPQVATRRNWDRETFLENTCLKAGLPARAWRNDDVTIMTFRAEVFGE